MPAHAAQKLVAKHRARLFMSELFHGGGHTWREALDAIDLARFESRHLGGAHVQIIAGGRDITAALSHAGAGRLTDDGWLSVDSYGFTPEGHARICALWAVYRMAVEGGLSRAAAAEAAHWFEDLGGLPAYARKIRSAMALDACKSVHAKLDAAILSKRRDFRRSRGAFNAARAACDA